MTVQLKGGKLTGSKDMLDSICLSLVQSANFYRQNGCITIANREMKKANAIHSALEKSGYYK